MNPFRFFRSSKTTKSAPITTSNRARRTRLRVEELEPREVPTSDIFTVTGAAGAQVTVNFAFKAHDSVFWDEIGVYAINDNQGRVGNFLPGDAGYAKAALGTAQTVFVAGDFEGATKTLTFTAGTRLAFYLIQNNTLSAWQARNPLNRAITGLQAFFSIDGVNRDRFDHLHTTKFGDRSMRLNWEDGSGGGDRDFNDDVINVNISGQETLQVPGVAGQNISTRFQFLSKAVFQNEVGFFKVDDVTGKIGTLNPGDAGYAAAALDPSRRTIVFRQRSQPGAIRNINMPGGSFVGLYLIQNGNSVSFLKHNPDNKTTGGPVAFFSLTAANPDNFKHMKWLSQSMFAWEDTTQGTTGADRDYRDFVGAITFRKPGNTAPFVAHPIANVNVSASSPNKVIDLAGVFDDRDLANSRVRFNTNFGPIDMVLFDRAARQTVANFYDYITDGDYNNTIFHRSAKSGGLPFVLQGGGFAFNDNGPSPTTLDSITNANTPTVPNEPDFVNRSNVRGTIAMAKGSDPNSATSQFFFNLNDNSTALNNTNNSGGFTVFGQVLNASTQHVVDAAAAIPTQAHASPFNEIPLKNYTFKNPDAFPGDTVRDNYLIVNSVTVLSRPEFLSYTATSSDPSAVSVSLVHEQMTLDFIHGTQSPVTITVTATDSVGHHTTTTFQVTVANQAPVSQNDTYTTNENAGALNVNAGAGVLSNDSDPDGNTLHAVKVTDPTNGAVVLNTDGSFTYTPNNNFHGTDTFTYKANDGQLDGNTATVTITVNAPPVAVDDSGFVVNENTTLNVPASGVLANDTDAESNNLTALKVSDPANGTVTVNSNGSFTYTPNANFHGTDSFTYKANDGQADSNVATVTITVNVLPVAVDNSFDAVQDAPLHVAAPGVLGNDTDTENDPLIAKLISGPTHGSLNLNSTGAFDYTPNAGFFGTDSFTYVANDGHGDSNVATVTITVDALPTAGDDSNTTDQNTPVTGNVITNDSDPDAADTLTVSAVNGSAANVGTQITLASGALLTVNSNGTYSYNPNGAFTSLAQGQTATDSFTYTVSDGHGGTANATVTITINGLNDAPLAVDDSNTTNENTLANGNVLANDSDVDTSDTLTVSAVNGNAANVGTPITLASGALLTVNADGTYSYDPNGVFDSLNLGESATDSFTYAISDGHGGTSSATVTITINGV